MLIIAESHQSQGVITRPQLGADLAGELLLISRNHGSNLLYTISNTQICNLYLTAKTPTDKKSTLIQFACALTVGKVNQTWLIIIFPSWNDWGKCRAVKTWTHRQQPITKCNEISVLCPSRDRSALIGLPSTTLSAYINAQPTTLLHSVEEHSNFWIDQWEEVYATSSNHW